MLSTQKWSLSEKVDVCSIIDHQTVMTALQKGIVSFEAADSLGCLCTASYTHLTLLTNREV